MANPYEKRIVLVSRGAYDNIAIGPVLTLESIDKIYAEAEERGWTVQGHIPLKSFAAFKAEAVADVC